MFSFSFPVEGTGRSQPQYVPESPGGVVDQLRKHEQTPVMNSAELDSGFCMFNPMAVVVKALDS